MEYAVLGPHQSENREHISSPTLWKGNTPQAKKAFSSHLPQKTFQPSNEASTNVKCWINSLLNQVSNEEVTSYLHYVMPGSTLAFLH